MAGTPTALPSGIVTFVFTDIEGSTRLLRRLGDRYAEVLERHFELMRQAWEPRRGHDLGGAGDSILLSFADADDALAACADAQRRLAGEPWEFDGVLRVRMGVHSGLAAPRDGRYVALAVHQAARVMAAAHGGQVLVSADTIDQLARQAAAFHTVDLGRYRLRDFEEPVRLYALAGPGLLIGLPAVRAIPAEGHNLPVPTTTFHGRRHDVTELAASTVPGRLVTLAGPGGVGKTRLATEVGLAIAADWPDGVWLVGVSPLQEDVQVPSAIGTAVGVPNSGLDRWDDVLDHLRSRSVLVILDGCERLPHASADAAGRILSGCPKCAVMATSREPLGLEAEHIWRVQPLGVAGADAIDLLVERARAVRQDFAVDDATAPLLLEICRRLDGLPLAIELAAARLAVLSPADVLLGLQDRFAFLRTHNPWVPERQRTMRGLLEWSERLLPDREAAAFRRLGVFGGAFGLEAAAAAVADDGFDEYDVPEVVWSLVDKSLVVADLSTATRYRLLESIREFARGRLDEHGEQSTVATRAASWYLGRFGPAHRHVRGWTGGVGSELDNMRALVPLLAVGHQEQAQELAFTIGRYLDAIQSFREGLDELTRYAADLPEPTPARIALLTSLADLHLRVGEVEAARRAVAAAEEVHARVSALPPWDDVAIERTRGDIACRLGDNEAAAEAAERALASNLSLRGQARMWSQLGIASLGLGDLDRAWNAFERELEAYRSLDDEVFEASAEGNLAEIALRRGDTAAAARHQQACMTLALALGAPVMLAFSYIVAARIAAGSSDWKTAATLHAQAELILDKTGLALYAQDREVSDEMLAAARAQLGNDAFAAASAGGRELDLLAASTLAGEVFDGAGRN